MCVCMHLGAYAHAYGHEYTVVMLKQPGHFTSMKKEFGDCTRRFSLCLRCSSSRGGCSRSTSPMEMNDMLSCVKPTDLGIVSPTEGCKYNGICPTDGESRGEWFYPVYLYLYPVS